jgi:Fe-S-cluster-containing hydrogenase component 2
VPYLYCDIVKCTGCRICELYCAFIREHALNPKKARLRVERMEPAFDKAIACMQCADPPCAKVCPTDAIVRNPKTEIVLIYEKKCIGCGVCVEACPFGVIWLHPDRKKAIKCDLCMRCIPRCPTGALWVETSEGVATRNRSRLVESWRPVMLEQIEVSGK